MQLLLATAVVGAARVDAHNGHLEMEISKTLMLMVVAFRHTNYITGTQMAHTWPSLYFRSSLSSIFCFSSDFLMVSFISASTIYWRCSKSCNYCSTSVLDMGF